MSDDAPDGPDDRSDAGSDATAADSPDGRDEHDDGGDADAGHGHGGPSDGAGRAPREEFRHDPVEHVRAEAGMSVASLVDEYGRAGLGAGRLDEAVDVTAEMFGDDVTVLFGLAGAMVPAGMRRVVSDLVCDGYVDALVTTGATLTHDAIEAIGGEHHHGRHAAPGRTGREHDERLREEAVDRIYDVYLPQEHFVAFETHLREEVFPAFEPGGSADASDPDEAGRSTDAGAGEQTADGPDDGTATIAEFTAALGRANAAVNDREAVRADAGIAAAAVAHDVPVYCPAVQDSVLGLQAWLRSQVSPFGLDALGDMSGLNDLANEADAAGAFVVGGGVPKNFVLQTMLVAPGAYDYGVQLTMDPPRTGGLSGATLDEARSWGKLARDARNVSVYADATITLPLVVAAARDRVE